MSTTHATIASRYRLGDKLGQGGMGVVWEAYDELLHRTVAVKEVHFPPGITPEERDRLARRTLREARAVAAVENGHAVRVFDIVEQDGRPWIVMELVRGRTLTDEIRERGALPSSEVARIGLALLDALSAAHRAGVLHRDVKPSNVLLGEGGRVALTDFGIATVDTDPSDVTSTGQIVGSPAYMAPERARGEAPSPAADLWSLGATLWTAVEGRPPFDGPNALATMTKVVSEPPPPCSRCHGRLADAVGGLLAAEPAERPTPEELRAALTQVLEEGDPAPSYPPDELTTAPLPPQFDRTVVLGPETRQPGALAAAEPSAPAALTVPPRERPAPASVPSARRSRSVVPVAIALVGTVIVAGIIAAVVINDNGSPKRGPGTAPASHPSAKHSARTVNAALPAGWHRYTDAADHWSIGVPAGWQVSNEGGQVFLRDPAGGRYLEVATRVPAVSPATAAWYAQERAFRQSHQNYQRLQIASVTWRPYDDAADWEFTYRDGGADLHADDRGAVVGRRGYGLFFQTHSDQWAASQHLRRQFYATFRPV